MRAFLVKLVIYLTLPLIPFQPFIGVLAFTWLAYMRPHQVAWGISNTRFSYWVAVATLVGLAVAIVRGRERFMTFRPQTVVLLMMLGWMLVALRHAINPGAGEHRFELFAKVVLMTLVVTGMVRTYQRFRALIIVTSFSLGLLAMKFGLFGLVRGGARFDHGPGGFMLDNNDFALALCMALPLLWGIATVERYPLLRTSAITLAAFCVLTTLFTFSRGGFLTLLVVGTLLLIHTKRRILTATALGLLLLGIVAFTSEELVNSYVFRARSIATYQEDSSAMGRIKEWQTAMRIARDHPVFGVGPDNLKVVFWQYSEADRFKVTHNAFLQWAVEGGLPAMGLFLLLLATVIWRMQRLRSRSELLWARTYARMVQFSVVAFMVGGMFLDRAYYDFIYHLAGMSVGLELAAEDAAASEVPETEMAPRHAVPWWRQQPAESPSTATGS